jgi:transposase-like protein
LAIFATAGTTTLAKGYRHRHRERQLTGTFGTKTVRLPRARIEDDAGKVTEWRSKALFRYQSSEAALVGLWGDDLPIQRCTVHKHRNLLANAPATCTTS